MPRAVLPGVAHHLTQRGVAQQHVFFSDCDRRVYLDLVRDNAQRHGVSLLGYCLMPNHTHWIVIPAKEDSLTKCFAEAHSRYAHYANAILNRAGHFWQSRFFSCAMDESHLWVALRYVERNPVRAELVEAAEDWPWSSARAHAGRLPAPKWLAMSDWQARFTIEQWRICLTAESLSEADQCLRHHTYTGRPWGSPDFVEQGEAALGRPLHEKKRGRRRTSETDEAASLQVTLFGAP